MPSTMRAPEISDFLKRRRDEPPLHTVQQDGEFGERCDVVYAIFLEPRPTPDPRWTTAERLIDKAVRSFQPFPVLAHCELVVPPVPSSEGNRTQFATYFGAKSAWQTDKASGVDFYLVENANRWRAVPIFSANAAANVRAECDCELGVDYSLSKYLTSTPPLNLLANWMPDNRRSPAHCATISARVLRNACSPVDGAPSRPSSYYGPSSLFNELTQSAGWRGAAIGACKYDGIDSETAGHVEQLLRGVMSQETVAAVGDHNCMEAVRALTMRACKAISQGDLISQRLTQQQLANALLRWVVLRQ
jgi:hypothetical protein